MYGLFYECKFLTIEEKKKNNNNNNNYQKIVEKDFIYNNIPSRYVFSCVICFRFIHFILISTVHAYLLNHTFCNAKNLLHL